MNEISGDRSNNIEAMAILSFYEDIAGADMEKKIKYVRHIHSNKICVKKLLKVYDREVISFLHTHPIKRMPRILDVADTPDGLVVIEQYISGRTLDDILSEKGHFSEEDTKLVISELCFILSDLHSATKPPIIHRDIKPSNLLITDDGTLYLLDVDAARFVNITKDRDTVMMGTPGFAAPEQYGFGSSTVQSDIYALGVLALTLLTGEVTNKCRISCSLSPFIRKCLELSPEKRFSNAPEAALFINNSRASREHIKIPKSRAISDIADGGGYDEYFCPNCNSILNDQPGYDPNECIWQCRSCGEFLFDDELLSGCHRFPDTMWHCDKCGALLNLQYDFDDRLSRYQCAECGYMNRIGRFNIRKKSKNITPKSG